MSAKEASLVIGQCIDGLIWLSLMVAPSGFAICTWDEYSPNSAPWLCRSRRINLTFFFSITWPVESSTSIPIDPLGRSPVFPPCPRMWPITLNPSSSLYTRTFWKCTDFEFWASNLTVPESIRLLEVVTHPDRTIRSPNKLAEIALDRHKPSLFLVVTVFLLTYGGRATGFELSQNSFWATL